ncbi:hypothetical protein SISNIDRAFT_399805, partial [Sistotremastrum niveocremeum HHB9708]
VYLVGIIPGPKKTKKDQINRLLAHVVDDLQNLWDPGFLIPTPSMPTGRRIRGALIPLVCDLPGGNEVAGAPDHNASMPCAYCKITLATLDNVEDPFDPRTCANARAHGESWRDAATEDAREKLESQGGGRWSELMRLPYWDPVGYKVLDTMHMLLEGMANRHCRKTWGMD